VRVLDSVDQIAKGPGVGASGGAAPQPKFLPQLSYNISKLVDMKASRMHVLDVKRRHEEQQLAALRREESSLQQRLQAQDGLLMRLQDIQKIVSGCRDRLSSDSGLTLDFAAKVFELLKGKFTYEYRKYKLEAIGHSLVFPLISRKLKDWNPLSHPDYGVAMMKSWRHIFSSDDLDADRDVMDMDDAEFEEDFFGRKKAHGDPSSKKQGDFDLFNRLLHEVVIPKFRNTIMVDWNPKDPSPLISVLVSWSEILSGPFMDILVSSAVLPRLQAAVDAWDPRRDTIPVHSWVLPWLRFLNAGDRIRSTLFDPIQRKLSQALVQWQATDRSALVLLKPWHTVFEDGAWERLLLKSIIPKLLDALRSKFAIDPSSQDLSVFKTVLQWLEVTPVQHFVTLMDLEFFPKFFVVLHAWLSSDEPDFDEVTSWYMTWKQQFPDALQNQERIKQLFAYALKMMNSALSADSPDQILAPPPAPQYSPLSFVPSKAKSQGTAKSQLVSQERGDSQRAANAAAPKKRTNTTFMDTVSLKELLESMATEKNILFMPIPNKTSGGKPVYKLGTQQVWFDKDLVHKWADGGWKPIHIDDLLEEAAQS
jgi:tuftelin-interacting protein 11